MAEFCSSEIYIVTAICDDYSAYRVGLGNGFSEKENCVMEFYPTNELGGMDTNWWAPNTTCLARMMLSSGFKEVEVWKIENPKKVAHCRGFAKGKK